MTDEEAAAIMGCTVAEARAKREAAEAWDAEQTAATGKTLEERAGEVFDKL